MMVGSIERIAQDIAMLDKAVAELAETLHDTYANYLSVLGQAVRQQLILACYQVCTQGYPEAFLLLTFSQRQQVQQTLKHLAQQAQEELLAQLHVPIALDELEPDEAEPQQPEPQQPELEAQLLEQFFRKATLPTPPAKMKGERRSLTPSDLARWQRDLERAIEQELRTASHAANRILQKSGVLPHSIPEPILDAATQVDRLDGGAQTPNLLNLIVETGEGKADKHDTESSHRQGSLRIMAIHLRLIEIEFADAPLNAIRNRIRSHSAQLRNLGREYQKKQRERAIAEAQSAWRTSWSED